MTRAVILAVAAALLVLPAPLTAQPVTAATIRNQEGIMSPEMPFILASNLICLMVSVNGAEPALFVLDTGAGYNGIDSAFAERIGLDLSDRRVSKRTGASYSQVSGLTFALSGLVVRGQTGKVQQLSMFSPFIGAPVAGILGYDFVKELVFSVDYARQRIRFLDPADAGRARSSDAVAFEIVPDLNWPRVTARIEPERGEPRDILLLIDTGAIMPLSIMLPDLCQATIPNTITMGITGAGQGGVVGRLKSISLGKVTIDRPLAAMPEAAQDDTADPISRAVGSISLGNVGGGLLRRFTVTFDYPGRTMYLEPNGESATPMEHDMCGAFIVEPMEEPRAFQVLAVTPGSPAQECGIAAGDLITAVDGEPAGKVGLTRMRELMKRDGKIMRLAVQRGGETLSLVVTLRRMI